MVAVLHIHNEIRLEYTSQNVKYHPFFQAIQENSPQMLKFYNVHVNVRPAYTVYALWIHKWYTHVQGKV